MGPCVNSLGSLAFCSLDSSTLLIQYRPWPLLNIKCDDSALSQRALHQFRPLLPALFVAPLFRSYGYGRLSRLDSDQNSLEIFWQIPLRKSTRPILKAGKNDKIPTISRYNYLSLYS